MLLVFLVCLSVACFSGEAEAATKSKKHTKSPKKITKVVTPYNPPYAHIVVDAATGRVLYQSDADRALYPASLTKIMTLLLTFEALDAQKISLGSNVIFSSHAVNMPPSRIGLKAGQSMTVENAIKALVTKSANDVAVALGEKLGGSEGRFAQMMNLKARQIGMTQTHFENASGLHNVRQVSSARDMAKLAMYLMSHYPRYYHYFSLREFTYNGKVNKNHNHLMATYRGMDGLKTGYINPSGFNLVASARRGNTRLIGVVFGGKTANSRNTQMATLLDAGFAGRSLNTLNEQPADRESPAVARETTMTLDAASLPKRPVTSADRNDGNKVGLLYRPAPTSPSDLASSATKQGSWAIQIGAYQDRLSTDQALYRALKALPAPLNKGNAVVMPLRTSEATWVFRARIAGYTRIQAIEACKYLDDCLPVSPNAN
ncbi:MAG TPA: D-alanyl-D-alanine carboxypeptidase [Rhodospirillaceae bacterium]|nr:D-alanyl-D-alanine carboxypeptidase [Rhodospirillaceae bacterium]